VNRSLPRGDRGHRSPDPCWAPRFTRALPRAVRLVGGVKATASAIRNGHCCATVGPRVFGSRIGQSVLGSVPEITPFCLKSKAILNKIDAGEELTMTILAAPR